MSLRHKIVPTGVRLGCRPVPPGRLSRGTYLILRSPDGKMRAEYGLTRQGSEFVTITRKHGRSFWRTGEGRGE